MGVKNSAIAVSLILATGCFIGSPSVDIVASRSPASNNFTSSSTAKASPTAAATDISQCDYDGGTWSSVPGNNNAYGCRFARSTCGNIYTKMFAADLVASLCDVLSTSIVASATKDGGKLCHNDWDGAVFRWRCTDNEPEHVQSECIGHIQAMAPDFFSVSKGTYQGTYIFPSSSTTVQYPASASISCYTKLYCGQNTTVGGWGQCNGAWGTACWPDFNANWLQDSKSNTSTTVKSTVSNVYCSKS